MKIIKIIAALGIAGFCNAQQISVNEIARWNKFIDVVANGDKKVNYTDVQGSAYLTKNFVEATINGVNNALVRYNLLTDTVEILNGQDVYELPISNNFSNFKFKDNNKTLILSDNGVNSGYYYQLVKGQYSLLKKEQVKFKPEVPAPNTLISDIPARFEKLKPVYYIVKDNTFVMVPKKMRDFYPLYSEKASLLEKYVKDNKLKIEEEQDLIKIVNFLNK